MVAVDGDVPLTMAAGGTSGDPAVYLIGSTAGYSYPAGGTVTLGSFSSPYNELILQNAGQMTIADGFNFDMRGNNSRLSIDGTLVGFNRSRLDMSLNEGTFDNRFFIQQNTGSSVEVRNGGVLATTAFVATSMAMSASLTIDGFAGGTNHSVLFISGNLTVASGSSLSVTIGNGGILEADNFFNIGTLNVSGQNGSRINLNAGQDFSVVTSFTMDAGSTLDLTGANSNLGAIAAGRTVMVTGGSLSGTTLDGGLLQVFSSFDAADLTLTSGTLELGGGSLTAGSGGPIALTANTSMTGFGTVTADINLNGGSVDGLVDPFVARNGIEFISDVRGSGTLTDVTLFKLLDVGSGGGAVSLIDGTLATGSSVLLDIAGTANGQYDTFSANLASDLTGGDLVVAFTAGFTPSPGDSWTLFSGGFDPATFASITLPSNTELRGYQLHAVPEPTSFCLMCCAAGVLFRRLRSRCRPTDQSSSRTPARSLSPFVLRGGSWPSLRGKL